MAGERPQEPRIVRRTTQAPPTQVPRSEGPIIGELPTYPQDNRSLINRHPRAFLVGGAAAVVALVGGAAAALSGGGGDGGSGVDVKILAPGVSPTSADAQISGAVSPTSTTKVEQPTAAVGVPATGGTDKGPGPEVSPTVQQRVDPTATATRPATVAPTAVQPTREPATPTVEPTGLENAPQPIKDFYAAVLELNKGVFKDATTGGPLSQADINKEFRDPLVNCITYTNSNPAFQANGRYAGCIGSLGPLESQFTAWGRNPKISAAAKILTGYLRDDYPTQYGNSVRGGQILPEFQAK